MFADAPIAADNRLPIIDAVGLAGKPLAGIGEIGDTDIEIDRRDLRTDTAGKGELGGWLCRQLDGGHRGAGVDLAKSCFEGGAGRGPMIGQRGPAIDVVRRRAGAGAELQFVG